MKVCMVVDKPLPSARPTGIGVAAFNMALALSRRKRDVHFICRGTGDSVQTPNQYLTVRETPHFTRRNSSLALEVLREGGCDILHSHSSSAVVSMLLGRASGLLVVSHAHGVRPGSVPMAIRRSIAMYLANAVVATDESTRVELVRRYQTQSQKIAVVHNAVDSEEFRPLQKSPAVLSKYGLGQSERIILTVGALRSEKGQLRMIESLPEVIKRWPKLVYVMVGPEEDRFYSQRIFERAAELGITKSVRSVGAVARHELVDLINSAELCVHPSTRSGSANDLAVMEEMACGKVVIAYGNDKNSRTVDDQENGLLLRTEDIGRLSSSISTMLGAPEVAGKLGREARRKAVSEFTWDEAAKNLEKVYLQYLN